MSSFTALVPPQSLLPKLAIAGTLFIWGGSFFDGSLMLLLKAVFSSYVLPGTEELLKRSITGIRWPLDITLNMLVAFFWEALDGSHPTSCALGLYFLAQFVPVLTFVYVNALRIGNSAIAKSTTQWLLVFQVCSIGATGPFWALSYLKNSPLVSVTRPDQLRSLSATSITSMLVLPLSIFAGFGVPAFLMCLKSPSTVSNSFQQKAIVLWNVFPLWVLCAQISLESFVRYAVQKSGITSSSPSRLTHINVLRFVNTLSVVAGFASHIAYIGFAISVTAFPGIWASGLAQNFTFGKLFIPPFPIFTSENSATVGDGTRSFFMWDMFFGFLIVNLVSIWEFEAAARAKGSQLRLLPTVAAVVISAAVFGPGTTALLISWARDELLFDDVSATERLAGIGLAVNGGLKYPVTS